MLTDAQVILLRKLPQKIEMVGGPFCGVILYTRLNRMTDVQAQDNLRQAKNPGLEGWEPIDAKSIRVWRAASGKRAAEVMVYRRQRDGRFLFAGSKLASS